MKRTHSFNLITGLALVAFTATGLAAELLTTDQKLSAELKEYTLTTASTTTESTTTEYLKTDFLESDALATGSLETDSKTTAPAEVTVIVRYKRVPDQQEVNRLTTLDASTKRAYNRLPMRAIRVPVDKLYTLADDADVEFITPRQARPGYDRGRAPDRQRTARG